MNNEEFIIALENFIDAKIVDHDSRNDWELVMVGIARERLIKILDENELSKQG